MYNRWTYENNEILNPSLEDIANDIYESDYFNRIADRVMLSSYLLENQNNIDIMSESLYDTPKYKNVISDEGKKRLKSVIYSEGISLNDTCPISQESFICGEEITLLPCNHGFIKGQVETWLESQCAECPICRYKLASIEIENTNSQTSGGESHINPIIPIRDSRNMFLSSLSTLENMTHPFGRNQIFNTIPHSYITAYLAEEGGNENENENENKNENENDKNKFINNVMY